MTSVPPLTIAGRAYVSLIATLGTAVVLHSIYALFVAPPGYQLFLLAGLTLLSGSFTVRIPTIPARLSVSETFVFAAAILYGSAAATIIVVLDSLIASLWLQRKSRRLPRLIFNMSAPSTAIWVASAVFFWTAGVEPLSLQPHPILSLVFPLLVMALLYFLLNSWMIAVAVALEQHLSALNVWRHNFVWLSLNYFSGASVAALLLPYLGSDQSALFRVTVTLLPLLLISYLTFKTTLGRVEDAHRHLKELNRLYLSTIETLAMAIDAKDQITHGHIRRVQQYAIRLAREIGIDDNKQLQAIEAASLLHDMGKLAIPEYILNKPGKLTTAEFEKMKLHASVGADILSAIDFPYPVIPIVRHHHENWDGSGYPDGLGGSDIPIGARILAVVDCFDALTSDRPYRPRLSDAEATHILLQRRGTMYDPLVVDTFLKLHAAMALEHSKLSNTRAATAVLPHALIRTPTAEIGLESISASTEEMVTLFELARLLRGKVALSEAAPIVFNHLRRLVPTSMCVFFTYDQTTDELVAKDACGEHAMQFLNLRVQRGRGVSGWVAANVQTIVNSDPVLDLGEAARFFRPRLRASLSTPVVHQNSLLGVLSIYSNFAGVFSDNDRRVVEAIAREIWPIFAPAKRPLDSVTNRPDEVSDDRARRRVQQLAVVIAVLRDSEGTSSSVVEKTIKMLSLSIKENLTSGDVLLSSSAEELLILLADSDTRRTDAVIGLIATHFQKLRLADAETACLTIALGSAAAPSDGTALETILAAARRNLRLPGTPHQTNPSVH